VRDVKLLGVGSEISPLMFLVSRRPGRFGALVVRTARDTQAIAPAIREAIQAVHLQLLFGLTATDATNLVAAIGVMVVVALAACTLPALRATRIDPLACIRDE
jgi:ABC-type antimicrobial peptide transport system permease subunit